MTSRSAVALSVLAGACLLAACGKPAEKPAAPEPRGRRAAGRARSRGSRRPAGVTKVMVASTHGA